MVSYLAFHSFWNMKVCEMILPTRKVFLNNNVFAVRVGKWFVAFMLDILLCVSLIENVEHMQCTSSAIQIQAVC